MHIDSSDIWYLKQLIPCPVPTPGGCPILPSNHNMKSYFKEQWIKVTNIQCFLVFMSLKTWVIYLGAVSSASHEADIKTFTGVLAAAASLTRVDTPHS